MITRPKGQATAVAATWTTSERWRLLFKGNWKDVEHNNVLELRTVVQVLRHLARNSNCWRRRVLVMTDSLVSLGVLSKGRSSARALLHLARVAASVQLAFGILLYLRWVPSERNVADGPSRQVGLGAAMETQALHLLRDTPKTLRWLFRGGRRAPSG